jgi:glycosyltransferase involved in cell wall biosynthesis
MDREFDVAVIVCTYNRCGLLPKALESVLAQDAGGVRYEVIVVDNNSTDETRAVVEGFISRGHDNLRYLFEGRQGKSYALNTGISNARAPVIAVTDDDICVEPKWLAAIKRAFDEHPEVDYVGGKVLPRWEGEPPAWLTPEHWAPLALQDYGDAPLYSNAERPTCLLSISVRREAFDRVGFFSTEFLRIGASSTEDHEFQIRLWRAGRQGLYVPDIVVVADVQADRMTKAYHRKWHAGHGKSSAMMGLVEMIGPDGRLIKGEPPEAITLFGVPAPVYRELVVETRRWLVARARRRESSSFKHENQARQLVNYIRKRYEQHAAGRTRSSLAEVGAFARAMLRKKTRALPARASK